MARAPPAATGDDPANLLIARLAKQRFGVRWTVARAANPAHRWLFTPEAGVDVVVRADRVLLPERAAALRAGDVVVALCEPSREHVLGDLLTRLAS